MVVFGRLRFLMEIKTPHKTQAQVIVTGHAR